jgi:glycosyltransferase involved in cell wall biosynthesis
VRILMVTPYPPVRDGIANYAVQEVRQLRRAGHDVEVLSPFPSAAHHHLDLRSRRGPLALARRVRDYDRVIVQFHPDVFYRSPLTPRSRESTTLGLLLVFTLSPRLEVRIHEVNYAWGHEPGRHRRLFRALWRTPDQITVHSDAEREALVDAFGVDGDRITVVDHGAHFTPRTDIDRTAARTRLGLAEDEFVFLTIGFIQPHKGFDRAVRAFARLATQRCRIDVVGSLRTEDPGYVAHVDELKRLVDGTPGAHLHLGYVSDELFDVWIVAADCLVLPYRHIWSSGVLERASLFGRAVIASRVGGLADQSTEGVVLVDSDDELVGAMRAAFEGGPSAPEAKPAVRWADDIDVGDGGNADRDTVMAAVRRRAAANRMAAPARFGDLALVTGQTLAAPRAVVPDGDFGAGSARGTASFASLPPLDVPPPVSRNPVAAIVKRTVWKFTLWQIRPIVDYMNHLRAAGSSLESTARTPSGDVAP